MNNYLRKFLVWGLGSIIVLFLLAVAVAAIFEDSIGKKIVLELNNHITSKLTVGDVNLSLIRHFPRASITLENTRLSDVNGNVLLETKELAFAMSFWSAFSDNPKIHKVQIEDGTLNLIFDAKGKGNYDIFKTQKSAGPSEFKLKISKAVFDHLTVNYKNANKKTDISATLETGELKGDFSAEQYLLELDTDWLVHYMSNNSKTFFKNKDLSIAGKFDINAKSETYVIKECKTDIAENLFDIKGTMKNLKSGLDFDMFATGDNIRVEKLFLLMDGISQKSLKDIKSKGIVKIETRVNGVLNAQSNPSVNISYNLTNGVITSNRITAPFENLSFKGKFSNGWAKNMRTSSFNLENCKGTFNGIPIGLELKVNNLESPMIDLAINGKLPLAKMYGLLAKDKIQSGSGYLTVNKVTIKGALADMKSMSTVQRVAATGDVDFDNASVTANGEVVSVSSGKILIRNNNISFDNIQLTGFDTKMTLEGSVSNYLPFLLNTDNGSKLTFKSSINAPFVNIEKVLKAYSAESTGTEVTETKAGPVVTGSSQNIFDRLDGRITINIDKVVNKKISGTNFGGVLLFEDGGMLVSGDLEAMDGDWNLEGRFSFNNGTNLIATLESSKINIKEFFRQSNNFDQSTITDAHLSGRLNSQMLLNLHWNEKGDFDMDHMHAYAAWSIDNGELNRLKLMESLSKFVKLEDLRHIRFVNLKNLIEIENGKIYLPAMYIQSNALNLTVSGVHNFNNAIDYNLKLNAGEIIMKKFNLIKSTGAESAKQKGFFNMYYHVTGTIDRFTPKKDRAAVLANFSKGEIRKQKILKALLEEFGSLPNFDNPYDWVDKGEKIASTSSNNETGIAKPVSLTTDIKKSWSDAKQTLKNPAKAAPPKSTRKTFQDEEDDKEEFLEFK